MMFHSHHSISRGTWGLFVPSMVILNFNPKYDTVCQISPLWSELVNTLLPQVLELLELLQFFHSSCMIVINIYVSPSFTLQCTETPTIPKKKKNLSSFKIWYIIYLKKLVAICLSYFNFWTTYMFFLSLMLCLMKPMTMYIVFVK